MDYLYTVEAVEGMLKECRNRSDGFESGGILVGLPNSKIITDVIPSKYADRGWGHYHSDGEDLNFLNRELKKYNSQGLIFMGDFHSHPDSSNMRTLSYGDLETCQEILTNPMYQMNNTLVMNIIIQRSNNLPIYTYVVSLDERGELVVNQAEIKLITKEAYCYMRDFLSIKDERKNHENSNSRHNITSVKKRAKNGVVRDRK